VAIGGLLPDRLRGTTGASTPAPMTSQGNVTPEPNEFERKSRALLGTAIALDAIGSVDARAEAMEGSTPAMSEVPVTLPAAAPANWIHAFAHASNGGTHAYCSRGRGPGRLSESYPRRFMSFSCSQAESGTTLPRASPH